MLDAAGWPLWMLAAVFAASAAVVWAAGSRLAGYVDHISERTGIGQGFAGLVILGLITSLPEVAVSATGALTGEAVLALNNVLGSVAAQVAILALADALIGREALTAVRLKPVVLLQAALNIILLALVAAAITAGDQAIGTVGIWSSTLLAGYLVSVWALAGYEERMPWVASSPEGEPAGKAAPSSAATGGEEGAGAGSPLTGLVVRTVIAGAFILVAGYLLSVTGSAAARRTGLGSAFFGATFVAVATSLPEISTMVAAVRLKRYELALGGIFGTNLFNAALVFLIDLLAPGEPILSRVGGFSAFGALMGLVLTAIFMAGVIERRDRTVLRMGWDSLAALFFYSLGIAVLWTLRDQTGQ